MSALLLLLACQDGGLTKHNAAPTANIVSPTDGQQVAEGQPLTLVGSAGDPDGLTGLVVTWRAGDEVLCEPGPPATDGATTCDVTLVPGQEVVTLQVADPTGASAEDAVTIELVPDGAPNVVITAPDDQDVLDGDDPVTLSGTVLDDVDAPETLTVWWESDVDGPLDVEATPDSDGDVFGAGTLSEGPHTLTLFATDSAGNTGSDAVVVTVTAANSAPTCVITAPPDSTTAEEGESVTFAATVADVDQAPETLTLTWTSDLDGALSTSAADAAGDVSFTTAALSQGTHVVTLLVTDAEGATCADDVLYSVGAAPTITLSAPADDDVVTEGAPLSFTATVADPDHSPGELTVAWSSDVDGAFSTEGPDSAGAISFSTSALSRATHVVTATVTDPDGLYGRAQVTVRVNGLPGAPTVSLSPTSPTTTDDLVVQLDAPATDPDGDAISYTYAWARDGVPRGAYTTDTLPAAATTKGETWAVTVTPDDGHATGTAGAASVVIVNTPPTAPVVTVTPTDPIEGEDDLTCAVSTASTDADGDAISYAIAWDVDGASAGTSATIAAADTTAEEVWTCTVTPDDGEDDGAVGADSVSILGVPVDYAHVQYPCSGSIARTTGTLDVYAWIYQPGVTDASGRGAGITAEVGVGDDGTDPETDASWSWTSASYNTDKPAYGDSAGDPEPYNNDEYVGTLSAPSTTGSFDFAYRVSTDGGLSWTYVDLGGTTCGGDGTIDGYDAANAGALTVTP